MDQTKQKQAKAHSGSSIMALKRGLFAAGVAIVALSIGLNTKAQDNEKIPILNKSTSGYIVGPDFNSTQQTFNGIEGAWKIRDAGSDTGTASSQFIALAGAKFGNLINNGIGIRLGTTTVNISGNTKYTPFYTLNGSNNIPLNNIISVTAGHEMYGSIILVSEKGDTWGISLSDKTSGQGVSFTINLQTSKLSYVEWAIERPVLKLNLPSLQIFPNRLLLIPQQLNFPIFTKQEFSNCYAYVGGQEIEHKELSKLNYKQLVMSDSAIKATAKPSDVVGSGFSISSTTLSETKKDSK